MRKLAISLRSSNAESYTEYRDAVSVDWYNLMQSLGWQYNWMLLPNLGMNSAQYAHQHKIEGLILTGGESLGCNTRRDTSENALLDYAIQHQLPVLGVCRGLQLLHTHFGGKLMSDDSDQHVATRHQVKLTKNLPFAYSDGQTLQVNSYHSQLLAASDNELTVMAQDNAGFAEGLFHQQKKIAGIMWHPEREATCSSFDRALFNWLFKD